mmetsp:Transcript_1851/g.5421  ORF Transcript_1851/g.5421 Transcript_1851/m.5421 type:complete len:526 (+) Transcript_1851:247-1824(+)|eukprot:CAMPEP_0206144044 /NCGR_PEP_ID=MMETSP1473-20131121/22843_1 /ASSEMBLY_ACC=CAM_ASM_001109 /TAXON_ID=1461547 /ORGANISM="Stichococcus sp, Strain RCC1054" /LENGTH=525 /DNA_ID=CAMNT_0053539729 /DNA_START=237 /DNA_END=1814 /DNA_ORIENTATION=+
MTDGAESPAAITEEVEDGAPPPAKRQKHSAEERVVPAARSRALRSVLKVFVVRSEQNFAQPWQMRPQRSSSGSAFVVDRTQRHIITNAHVISNATTVHVRAPGNPKKWRAKVLCDGKVCDLALLTVEDEAFWTDDMQSLTFVSTPELQDEILVAGYPMGGDSLSITKGIVSRVVLTRYAHASNKLLGVQIDAAINPGNSGGPAFANLDQGLVSGVAFSKISHADNVGYIIPQSVVRHFLSEFTLSGRFRGVCSLGFRWQDLESQGLRAFLQVPQEKSGCVIYELDPLAPAAKVLQQKDVVLSIEGTPIADDCTVQFRHEERVEFVHAVRSKHVGDQINLRVLRDGTEMDVRYEVRHQIPLVPVLDGVDCFPSYFIVGGLVILPLSVPFLGHAFGSKHFRTMCPIPILAVVSDYQTEEITQVVVLFQVLAAEINFGHNKVQAVRILGLNGVKLRNLAHLAELVDSSQDKFLNFEMEGGKFVVLDRVKAMEDGPTILQQHAIAFDRSADLRELQETAQLASERPDSA